MQQKKSQVDREREKGHCIENRRIACRTFLE